MCRRATGGVFAVLVWFKQEAIRWMGEAPRVHRSSPIAARGFCGACGSPLFLRYDGRDDIALTAGSLDEPERFPARHHYGAESRVAWVDCGAELPATETQERF
jgi:hypothetical protein